MTKVVDAIEEVCRRLAKYPQVAWTRTQDSVSIQPVDKDGFEIELRREAEGYYIRFGHWHSHPDSQEEAFEWVAFGLSDMCRLSTQYRWFTVTSATVEVREDRQWRGINETGPLFLGWLLRVGPSRVVIQQNRLISAKPSDWV